MVKKRRWERWVGRGTIWPPLLKKKITAGRILRKVCLSPAKFKMKVRTVISTGSL